MSWIWTGIKKKLQKIHQVRLFAFYRKLNGLTQVELAEKLDTTKQFISNMENNRKPISRIMAKKLSKLFKVSAANFI